MWDELLALLATFPTAVLTGLDADAMPASVRCTPDVDATFRVLRGPTPPGLHLRCGAASLLCHSHDEQLWNLRSFLVRGHLEVTDAAWAFTPHQLILGQGVTGPLGDARTFLAARRRAARYLRRRNLTAPPIPWDDYRRARTG